MVSHDTQINAHDNTTVKDPSICFPFVFYGACLEIRLTRSGKAIPATEDWSLALMWMFTNLWWCVMKGISSLRQTVKEDVFQKNVNVGKIT